VNAEIPENIDAAGRDALERLAVFRFDFSIQAAYALLNYDRPDRERLAWQDVDERLQALISKKAVFATRGRYYIAPQLLPKLRDGRHYSEPDAHLSAAKSLAPILEPRNLFIASNRDRTLEPENVLEATWHLHRARVLVPPRNQRIRSQCKNALSTLTFLRPFPDWDTVKQLLYSPATLADAVDLGRELLSKECSITGRTPHSSRVSVFLNAIGDLGRSLNGPTAESLRAQLADEATALFTDKEMALEAKRGRDPSRQKRKLFSEYVYCMKMLGVTDKDSRVSSALSYLDNTFTEVVSKDFYLQDLDDYPVSWDLFKTRWSDPDLAVKERSTQAYVASRIYIGRWREGVQVREPWDQPWIEYFSLTIPEDFYAPQLHNPLATWNEVYGHDRESAEAFGQRVRDFGSYLPSKENQEWCWGNKIRSAADNLWQFITHSEDERRLRDWEADIALRLIDVIALRETLPAFDFIERRGEKWFGRWPEHLGRCWSKDWNNVAGRIISGQAGWVSMLSFSALDDQTIEVVRSWLHAYRNIGAAPLENNDPERLLERGGSLALVDTYRRKRAAALWNGYQLLAQRNERGWTIYGDLRVALENILRDIGGTTNSWFFAIATREPEQSMVAGACLMLKQHVSDASLQSLGHGGLERLKAQLRRNLSSWARLAKGHERPMFENLRQQFTPGSFSRTQHAKLMPV
jgi:hypothetical protein